MAGSGVELHEEGWRFAVARSPDEAIRALDTRLQARVLDYLTGGGWVLLRAGLARVGGARVLVVAEADEHVAAMMTRMLLDGAAVEGGAIALTRDGVAMAFPQCLRVSRAVLANEPALRDLAEQLPHLDGDGGRRWALDPRALAGSWSLPRTPVDVVCLADVTRAAEPAVERADTAHASRWLLGARLDDRGSRAARVRHTTALLRGTEAYRLTGTISACAGAVRALAGAAAR
jgi:hypothetical protein